jgi:hypothetical protein
MGWVSAALEPADKAMIACSHSGHDCRVNQESFFRKLEAMSVSA